jgi:1,6-anhydro-N-acetylmuramate kinase
MECYPAMKKKEIMSFAGKLKVIMLGKIYKLRKINTACFLQHADSRYINTHKQTERHEPEESTIWSRRTEGKGEQGRVLKSG